MRKIGIITFHSVPNYGAMLQAYALQEKLKSLGFETEIIDYKNAKIENRYKIIDPTNMKTFIKSIIKLIINPNKIKRNKVFNKFVKQKLKLSKKYLNERALKKDYPEYDVYITGSDQVWNSDITHGVSDIYTLNFGKDDILRISYAASIGKSEINNKDKNDFSEKLKKIDKISVREEDGKNILNNIINKDINVVLDPALLFNKKEWEEKIKLNVENKEKYIVAYVLSPDEQYIKIVNDLSEKTGLKVVHFGIKNPGYKNVLKSAYTEGPLEFVNYIKNAEYVVATSFHATVFSIIFNKKFFIVPHKKTGARVTNLLDKLEIKNRTFNSLEEFKNIDYNFETDWEKVNKNLEIEREKSLQWLENAINSEKGKKNV